MMSKLRLLTVFACAVAASSSRLDAQSFVEFAAGSNWVHPRIDRGGSQGHGFTGRASFGERIAPNVVVRLDADVNAFDNSVRYYPPCAPPGCSGPSYYTESTRLAGLSVNALANLDSRGLFYVVGGGGPGFGGNESDSGMQLRISAGGGLVIPSGQRFRIIAEARWLGLVNAPPSASWLIPITLGIRY